MLLKDQYLKELWYPKNAGGILAVKGSSTWVPAGHDLAAGRRRRRPGEVGSNRRCAGKVGIVGSRMGRRIGLG